MRQGQTNVTETREMKERRGDQEGIRGFQAFLRLSSGVIIALLSFMQVRLIRLL